MPPTAAIRASPNDAGRPRRGSRVDYAVLANQGNARKRNSAVADGRQGGSDGSDARSPETAQTAGITRMRKKSTLPSIPAERPSNVTQRTKPRRTGSDSAAEGQRGVASDQQPQRHTISVVDESHGSIITLDESTTVTNTVAPRLTRNALKKAVQATEPPRRRRATNANGGNKQHDEITDAQTERGEVSKRSTTTRTAIPPNRAATKRKGTSAVQVVDGDASPAKKASPEPSKPVPPVNVPANKQPMAVRPSVPQPTANTGVSARSTFNNPFKVLIVSVKRVAPAMDEAALKRLKYPELEGTRETQRFSHRRTSVPAEKRATIDATKQQRSSHRLTLSTKPQIVFSTVTEEEPSESNQQPSAIDTNANTVLPPPQPVGKGGPIFRKPQQAKPPTTSLPLVIEEEDETTAGGEGVDVYDFLSSTQTSSGDAKGSRGKSKKAGARKLKQPKEKKTSGPAQGTKGKAEPKKKVGGGVGSRKPAVTNPFGCNGQRLARVIKNIGGGRVKPPATADYVVHFEIPETPVKPQPSPVQVHDLSPPPPPFVSSYHRGATNPTVERLKSGCPPALPHSTSTPVNRGPPSTSLVPDSTPPHNNNPASPWRLQDELIVPRTSYVPRTREMLPSYESFSPKKPNHVTERPRPAPLDTVTAPTVVVDVPSEPPGAVVSEKNFREIERMYGELKATSEMSEKLITVMRRYKAQLAGDPSSPQQDRREYESNMQEACAKLKQWYERSMRSLNRSMRIIGRIQRAADARPAACPSPLSFEQQRTVDNFNLSTDRFRTMIDELHAAMNDSNGENQSPPQKQPAPASFVASTAAAGPYRGPQVQKPVPQPPRPKAIGDVILLPDRTTNGGQRNPLMPLNFVPLPQRNSPLLSPLATESTNGVVPPLAQEKIALIGGEIRRELRYENDQENEKTTKATVVPVEQEQQPIPGVGAYCEVLEVGDETTDADDNDGPPPSPEHINSSGAAEGRTTDLFGFEDDIGIGNDDDSLQATQVTLPMPLNISAATLEHRLRTVQRLIPKEPIFRRAADGAQMGTGGPTRFPVSHLRVLGSPTERVHTLHDFVASTPRAELSQLATATASSSSSKHLTAPPLEAPDVSAIETSAVGKQRAEHDQSTEPEVVLFDTPEETSRINRSAHQRTYTRIPRRRRKKNIYLANLGLSDDDDEDEDGSDGGEPQQLSSDSESEEAKRKRKKAQQRKAAAGRKAKPAVEETKEFKQFVQEFNSMCEEVERFEVIIE